MRGCSFPTERARSTARLDRSPEAFDPEQFGGIASATDIWALGCCVLELLSGEAPWAEMTHMQIMRAVCDQHEAPSIPPGLPMVVDGMLRRCFATAPSSRPSAREVHGLLVECLHDSSVTNDDASADEEFLQDLLSRRKQEATNSASPSPARQPGTGTGAPATSAGAVATAVADDDDDDPPIEYFFTDSVSTSASVYTPAFATLPLPESDPPIDAEFAGLSRLCEMGFEMQAARAALVETGGNLKAAATRLMDQPPDVNPRLPPDSDANGTSGDRNSMSYLHTIEPRAAVNTATAANEPTTAAPVVVPRGSARFTVTLVVDGVAVIVAVTTLGPKDLRKPLRTGLIEPAIDHCLSRLEGTASPFAARVRTAYQRQWPFGSPFIATIDGCANADTSNKAASFVSRDGSSVAITITLGAPLSAAADEAQAADVPSAVASVGLFGMTLPPPGKVYASIGVTKPDTDVPLGVELDTPPGGGAIITRLAKGSLATRAGLRIGDQIVIVASTAVTDSAQCAGLLRSLRVGTSSVQVVRKA
jgi:hypothetical protein